MIAGRSDAREAILSRIRNDSLAHAVLLTGPRGIGKREMALWIARAVVCESEETPCGVCESCRSFDSLSDLDLRLIRPVDRPIWIERDRLDACFHREILSSLGNMLEEGFLLPPLPDPARRRLVPLRLDPNNIFRKGRANAGLDRSVLEKRIQGASLTDPEKVFLREILQTSFSIEWYRTSIGIGRLSGGSGSSAGTSRDSILSFIGRKPAARRRKVVIVEEADRMTEEAQNSFLKTLEEPPADSMIVLTSYRRKGLLDTIRSRCEEIRLVPPLGEERAKIGEAYFTELREGEWDALLLLADGVPGNAAEIDLERSELERREAEALLRAAGNGPFGEYFSLLESWVDGMESSGENEHVVAARRVGHFLLLARERGIASASGEEHVHWKSADRLFRAAHATLMAVKPGANLRLLMEEFGVDLWRVATPVREGSHR